MISEAVDLSAILNALADSTRRGILQRLAQGPATAGQLADLFVISRPGVSRHIRLLREAGVIEATPRGRQLWYEARVESLERASHWIADVTKRIADAPSLNNQESV